MEVVGEIPFIFVVVIIVSDLFFCCLVFSNQFQLIQRYIPYCFVDMIVLLVFPGSSIAYYFSSLGYL